MEIEIAARPFKRMLIEVEHELHTHLVRIAALTHPSLSSSCDGIAGNWLLIISARPGWPSSARSARNLSREKGRPVCQGRPRPVSVCNRLDLAQLRSATGEP